MRNQGQPVEWLDTSLQPSISSAVRPAMPQSSDEALRESEQRHRVIAELTSDYATTCRIEQDGKLVVESVTDGFSMLTGYSAEEMNSERGWSILVHPEDLLNVQETIQQWICGESCTSEVRIRRKDGKVRWVRYLGRCLPGASEGSINRLYLAVQDITRRKRSEALLQAQKEVLEMMVHGRPLADILEALCAIVENQTDEELVATVLLADEAGTRLSPAAGRSAPAGWTAAIHTVPIGPQAGSCGTAAYRREPVIVHDIATDPLWEPVRDLALSYGLRACSSIPIFCSRQTVLGTFAVYFHRPYSPSLSELQLLDVLARTAGIAIERDRQEAERQRCEEQLARDAHLLACVRDAMVVTDLAGIVTYWNEGATRLYGWTAQEMMGRPYADRYPAGCDQQFVAANIRSIADGTDWNGEWEDYRKDGSRVWVEAHVSRVNDRIGRPLGILGLAYDITGRRRSQQLEECYRQAQKMEAIGRLAGGIAHDFNNLLTAINGFGEVLQDVVKDDEQAAPLVEEIVSAGRRAARLTGQLLAYGRKQITQPTTVDLNGLIQNLGNLLTRLLGEDVDVQLQLADDLHAITADPGQLEQLVMNLVVNARDAMPTGGTLMIETANVAIEAAPWRPPPTDAPTDSYIRLTVRDTGIGMDQATQSRIFEPYFTTKEQGKGTGLGLPMVYGIVNQAGGHIYVQSEVGKGATFEVLLPAVTEEAKRTVPKGTNLAVANGTETVLLVEDEPGVRELTRLVLQKHGYTVLEAQDGTDGLNLAAQYPGVIHIVVTDVVMPGMSARQMVERVKVVRPGIKVLYMSGHTDDAILRHGISEATMAFLGKPFSPRGFACKVRDVLDSKQ